jgi:hypothetical protein
MCPPAPPPLLLQPPTAIPWALDDQDQRRLADALGLETLTGTLLQLISTALSTFKKARAAITLGVTKAALDELEPGKHGDDVDQETLARLRPFALAASNRGEAERQALIAAACQRAAELQVQPRIDPHDEALLYFCGIARLIFSAYTVPTVVRSLHNCRRFVLEMLAIADVDCADFDAHPDHLDQYLRTDMSEPEVKN